MCLVASLSLQALLFVHLALVLRYGVSLWGEGPEILLLVITIGISLWILLRMQLEEGNRWLKGLYLLNCVGQLPIWLTTIIMVLFIYATDTIGAFKTPNGTHILLKSKSGLLGCSVDPYVVQGMFEQLIQQEDYISCFNFLDTKISKTTWNADETELTVSVENAEDIEYTFNLRSEIELLNILNIR